MTSSSYSMYYTTYSSDSTLGIIAEKQKQLIQAQSDIEDLKLRYLTQVVSSLLCRYVLSNYSLFPSFTDYTGAVLECLLVSCAYASFHSEL